MARAAACTTAMPATATAIAAVTTAIAACPTAGGAGVRGVVALAIGAATLVWLWLTRARTAVVVAGFDDADVFACREGVWGAGGGGGL